MNPEKPRFFELCVSGVSLWPLYFSGLHKFYPGPMHARLMIEGFLAGFVIGFLCTALPRLLSAPLLRRWELWMLLSLYVLAAGLHIGEQPRAGDAAFSALILCFGVAMAARVRSRAELPPPGFVLVAFGYLSGLFGPLFWLAGLQGWVSASVMMFGAILLNQGFVLFPLLGVGALLLPRILRLPGTCAMTEERAASPGWRLRAAFSCAVGCMLLGSFWIAADQPAAPAAAWLRAIAVIVYLLATIPFHRQTFPLGAASIAAQAALVALVAGLIFPLFFPTQPLAGLHIIFLGGFSLITFTVATRVVLGHSGNEALFEARLPALQVTALLLLAGAALRAVGDFLPSRPAWLSAASYLWMLAAAVWGFSVLPKVRLAGAQAND